MKIISSVSNTLHFLYHSLHGPAARSGVRLKSPSLPFGDSQFRVARGARNPCRGVTEKKFVRRRKPLAAAPHRLQATGATRNSFSSPNGFKFWFHRGNRFPTILGPVCPPPVFTIFRRGLMLKNCDHTQKAGWRVTHQIPAALFCTIHVKRFVIPNSPTFFFKNQEAGIDYVCEFRKRWHWHIRNELAD